MTIAELINALCKYPDHMKVVVDYGFDEAGYDDIKKVEQKRVIYIGNPMHEGPYIDADETNADSIPAIYLG